MSRAPIRRWQRRWQALPLATRARVRGALLGIAALFVAGLLLHRPIGRWLAPDARPQALRLQAEQALRQGELSSPDGRGARELFEAALALQPDHVRARDGLQRVALAAVRQAEAALDAGRPAAAAASLQLARDLQAPVAQVNRLQARLAEAGGTGADAETLLSRASLARADGRLDGAADAALPLYRQVLLLQPRNQRALEGREDALDDLLAPAPALLGRSDLQQLAALVARAESYDAGHPALPALHAELADAIEMRLASVRRHILRGHLDAAFQGCEALAGLPSATVDATCGAPLAQALLVAARRHATHGDRAAAARLLERARDRGADARQLAVVAALVEDPGPARRSDREVRAQSARSRGAVITLLAGATRAAGRGDWLTPPGRSAIDLWQQARAAAPADQRVRAAGTQLRQDAQRCHRDGLRNNHLTRARACFDAWWVLAPADAALVPAQHALAMRWLALAEERLGAGDADAAATALETAGAIDANTPGLAALRERLSRARAASPR